MARLIGNGWYRSWRDNDNQSDICGQYVEEGVWRIQYSAGSLFNA